MRGLKTWCAVLMVVLATGSCQAKDRAGGSADITTTELRFAVTGDPGTQITAWANEVGRLSKGSLKITFVQDEHAGRTDYEARMITDVQAGHVDLAWVGARAFDLAGLTTFQPLLAPLLIDSLELEGKVFEAGIPQQLLSSLDRINLVGVGVLPGPLRKVLGIARRFTTPRDFKRQVVGIQASGVAEDTFTTLGGTTMPMTTGAKDLSRLDAYDQQLWSIQGNHYVESAKANYVTGNLNLWPRPLVIIANPASYRRLTDDQREVMTKAAEAAIPLALETERGADAKAITSLCEAGLTFAQSSSTDLAAFQDVLAPVYRKINSVGANATVTNRIEELKRTLHRAPDGADCSSISDQDAATRIDGTYRKTTDYATLEPCPDDVVTPRDVGVSEIIIRDGSIQMWNWPASHEGERDIGWDGTYTFFKDQLRIGDSLAPLTFDVAYDGKALTLSNLRGGTCGDARAWTTGRWVRQ